MYEKLRCIIPHTHTQTHDAARHTPTNRRKKLKKLEAKAREKGREKMRYRIASM